MGYTGRPGPLVSELDVKGVSLFVCTVVDSPAKEPGWKLSCFLLWGDRVGAEIIVGCVFPQGHLLSHRVSLGALA